jgi:hypothetical protein
VDGRGWQKLERGTHSINIQQSKGMNDTEERRMVSNKDMLLNGINLVKNQ